MEDFMFQLTKDESLRFQNGTLNDEADTACVDEEVLRFQNGTLKLGRGKHLKYQPYAFTENGIAMLSSVLRSERAIAVNVRIMREFTTMRRALASMAPMQSRLEAIERRQIVDQSRNEERFDQIFAKTICGICHDRFIIADQKEIYWSGASLKDAGRLTFAAAKLGAEMIPGLLASIRKATSATSNYKKGGEK